MGELIRPWLGAIFCATLVGIKMFGSLAIGGDDKSSDPAFYCFLPMCFYFVGMYMSELRKENKALKARIDEITQIPALAERLASRM